MLIARRSAALNALRTAAVALVAVGLAACGGGGGSGDFANWNPPGGPGNDPALKVILVSANTHTNWARNEPIEFVFSAPLSANSLKPAVISRAIQISVVTANGSSPAKGSFDWGKFTNGPDQGKEDRKKLVFDPTRTAAADSLGCADNPFGFQPFTTYRVTVPVPPAATRFLTSRDGDAIVEPFTGFFTTSESYLRESVQPRFVGTDGQQALGFDPVKKANGEVPYNSKIIVEFSEAMDPNTFDPATNILIKNETLSALQGTTVLIPGTFTTEPCGLKWKFSPSFSYGGAGYDMAVILTGNLKDLAGNPLSNPGTYRFRTEVKPGVPTVQNIIESFDNQAKRDAVNTTADWGVATIGTLAGGAVTTQLVEVKLTTGGTRTQVRDHPFAQVPTAGVGHDQWTYTQAELGGAGAIVDVGWGPSSNALFASSHPNVTVILGHIQGDVAGLNFANNFDVGTPVTVTSATYNIPQRANIDPPNLDTGYWSFPTFSSFFEYNGKNNLLLDVDAAQGTNYQITRIYFGPIGFPNRHAWAETGSSTAVANEPVVTDMRFTKKRRTTLAQSLFYDSGQVNPNYATPIISPPSQSGGVSISFEYEGADGVLFPIPGNPNNVIPDPSTFTGYVTNMDQLDGKRFVRFRATLIANVGSGAVPAVQSLSIPYIF